MNQVSYVVAVLWNAGRTIGRTGWRAGGRWCGAMRSRDDAGYRRWPTVLASTVMSVSIGMVFLLPGLALRLGVLNLILATIGAWVVAAGIGFQRRRSRRAAHVRGQIEAAGSPWAWNSLAAEMYETLVWWLWSSGQAGMPPAEALQIARGLKVQHRHRLMIVAENVASEPLAEAPKAWWTTVAAGLRDELYPKEVPRSGLPGRVIPLRHRQAS